MASGPQQTPSNAEFYNQLSPIVPQYAANSAAFGQQANQAANQVQTNFSGLAPTLQTNFSQHTPTLKTEFGQSQGLDSFSQNVLSQGYQDQNNKLLATQQQLSQKYGNSNPALAGVLGQQAAIQSQLSTNPMLFQAASAQRAREGQEQAATNQARLAQSQAGIQGQALGNQAQLQRTEVGANLQGMGNAALAQQLQMRGLPMQSQQGLIALLAALSGLAPTQTNNEYVYRTADGRPLGTT